MKKRTGLILAAILVMLCFTGCMRSENTLVLHEDGSGTVTSSVWIDKAAVDDLAESLEMTREELGLAETRTALQDGREYYVAEDCVEFSCIEELETFLKESGYTDAYAQPDCISFLFVSDVTEDDLTAAESMGVLTAGGDVDGDLNAELKATLTITMPKEIVFTTGILSEDKMSAEFIFEGTELMKQQEIVVSAIPAEEETGKPEITGAKSKKTYNSARTIRVKDPSGIRTAEYRFRAPSEKKYGEYTEFGREAVFTKNGTYNIRVYDNYGNKAVRTFTIKDTKKPQIQLEGTMNKNQTYYKKSCQATVSDNCGIKSVRYSVDGKRVKISLAEVLEQGICAEGQGAHEITVTDVNGNKRTVTFSIR